MTFLYRSVSGRTETSACPHKRSASAGLTPMTLPVSGSQTRGGRKGGLPVCECNGLLAKDMGMLPSSNGKIIKKGVPTKPKQFVEHVAMDEQQSPMAFSECNFLCGQQSMSSIADDMWSMEADMSDMPTDFVLRAASTEPGSMATDTAIKKIRIVRTRCMGSGDLPNHNSRIPDSTVK